MVSAILEDHTSWVFSSQLDLHSVNGVYNLYSYLWLGKTNKSQFLYLSKIQLKQYFSIMVVTVIMNGDLKFMRRYYRGLKCSNFEGKETECENAEESYDLWKWVESSDSSNIYEGVIVFSYRPRCFKKNANHWTIQAICWLLGKLMWHIL
jgi:hypothetical protein